MSGRSSSSAAAAGAWPPLLLLGAAAAPLLPAAVGVSSRSGMSSAAAVAAVAAAEAGSWCVATQPSSSPPSANSLFGSYFSMSEARLRQGTVVRSTQTTRHTGGGGWTNSRTGAFEWEAGWAAQQLHRAVKDPRRGKQDRLLLTAACDEVLLVLREVVAGFAWLTSLPAGMRSHIVTYTDT